MTDAEGRITEVVRAPRRQATRPSRTTCTLPGPHRGVWNLDALRTSRELILCEALLDALTFWIAGYHNVTAAYGTNGLHEGPTWRR